MRLLPALALAIGLAAPAASAQDPKIEEILTLMERRVEGLQDLRFQVEQKADPSWGMPVQPGIAVAWLKGTGLRLRASLENAMDMPIPAMPRVFDVIYTADSIRLVLEYGTSGANAPQVPGMSFPEPPLSLQAFRLRYEDPAAKSVDLQLLPQGFPIRLMFDEPFAYYMIAPRFFFARESGLTYGGLTDFAGKPCHLIVSKPGSPAADAPRPMFWFESKSKEFFIDPETGALLQVRWELAAHAAQGMSKSAEPITFVTQAVGSQKVTDKFSLPDSVKWTIQQGRNRNNREQTMSRLLRGVKVNAGVAPEAILSDAEKNDLYADAVLRTAPDYEARLEKDPKNAEALYSFAHAKSVIDPYTFMQRGNGEKPDYAPVARALEKAIELRPGADGPVLNLLSAYKAAGEDKAEKELLDRIVKGEIKNERVKVRAAVRLNAISDFDRAAKLLAAIVPASESDRRLLALERICAAAGMGDDAALVSLFLSEAKLREDTNAKGSFVDSLEAKLQSMPEAAKNKLTGPKLLDLLDKALKENPGEIAIRLARASVKRLDGHPAAAAAELLEAAPEDEAVVRRATAILFPNAGPMGRRGRREPEAAKEWEPEEAARLVAALGKVKVADPAVKLAMGRGLAVGGKADDSRKLFAEALEACRTATTGKPRHAESLRICFMLGQEKGPAEWREQCVEMILTIGKDSTAIPYDLIYDEAKNPVMGLSAEYLTSKQWMKYYSLACRSNQVFKNWYWARTNSPVPKEGFAAIKAAVFQETEAAKYVQFADFLEASQGDDPSDLAEVLEKAVEKSPADLDLQVRLARTYGQSGPKDKAVAAFDAVIEKLSGDKQLSAKVELMELVVQTQPDKAKAVLATIDPAATTRDHALQVIEICNKAQQWDKGLEVCRKAVELGLAPHFRMGWFHEKKENYIEALRCYNKDRAEGAGDDPRAQVRRMEAQARRQMRNNGKPQPEAEDADPETGEDARTKLLKKLGPDYLISRFLTKRFDPLPPDGEKAVKAAVEKLASDESRERDAGFAELKKIGPNATPLLRSLLEGTEPEVKSRVRQLFSEWAEPR